MSDENGSKRPGRRTLYPDGVKKQPVPLTLSGDEIAYLKTNVAPSSAAATRLIVRSYLAAEQAALSTGDVSEMYDGDLLALWQATLRLEARMVKMGNETGRKQAEARRKQVEAEVLTRVKPAVTQGGLAVNT